MKERVTIEFHEYGILIMESIEINFLLYLTDYFKKHYKYDLLDTKISLHYGAAFCMTNKELSSRWREKLKLD